MRRSAGLREVIALVLALILWVYVRTTRTSNTADTLAQMQMSIPIELKEISPSLTPYEVSHDQARVTVQGDTQAVASLREQQLRAYVDLKREEGPSLYPKVQVIVPGVVKLISVEPENIIIKQAAEATQRVPVKVIVAGSPAKGRTLGAAEPDEKEAIVSGPEPLVKEIAEVRAKVVLSGQSADTSFEVRDLVPVNADGQPVESRRARLKVVPTTVWVTVPVRNESYSVALAVSLQNVQAEAVPGWRNSLQVVPEFVTLRISRDQQPPEFIQTEPAVFAASTRVQSREVALDIPDGYEVIGQRSVHVRCIPTPEQTPQPKPLVIPTPTPH